jgi:hypothetical protein
MTTKQRIATLRVDAKTLRHCGFNARADYQMMHIVVRTSMTLSCWNKLQEVMTESCIMVADGFLVD